MAEVFSSLVVDVVSLYCRSALARALASATLCRSEQQGMDVQGSSPLVRVADLSKFNHQNHNFVFRIEITIFSQPFFFKTNIY